jgi:hypothetical protein
MTDKAGPPGKVPFRETHFPRCVKNKNAPDRKTGPMRLVKSVLIQ